MAVIYSTMSTDVAYVDYTKAIPGAVPKEVRRVTIKGGANVANKKFDTPPGVATEVSGEDMDFLSKHPTFKRHLKNGFVVIHARKVDPEVAAADMEQRDNSAPLRPEDFEKPPVVAKAAAG